MRLPAACVSSAPAPLARLAALPDHWSEPAMADQRLRRSLVWPHQQAHSAVHRQPRPDAKAPAPLCEIQQSSLGLRHRYQVSRPLCQRADCCISQDPQKVQGMSSPTSSVHPMFKPGIAPAPFVVYARMCAPFASIACSCSLWLTRVYAEMDWFYHPG